MALAQFRLLAGIINQIIMKQQEDRHKISRKPLHGKQLNGKMLRWRKSNSSFSPGQHIQQKKKEERQQASILKLNEQSISFIAKNQQGSFISNGHDHSIDSFDKMIIGVEQVLDLQQNGESQQPNYSLLYKQFERLCKREHSIQSESQQQQQQNEISVEEAKHSKERSWEQQNQSSVVGKTANEKLEEAKEVLKQRINTSSQVNSDPNISIRLLGGNLSEIHQQQIQHDSSMHKMDPIEEEFIDFVSKGQGHNKINISKIEEHGANKGEKKVSFKGDTLKETEQDEVVAMLENQLISRGEPQEESINQEQASITKKPKKESFFKENYNQILSQLDQNQQKKLAASYAILAKRTEWIKSRGDKSERWKGRQLQLIGLFRDILQNPYLQNSDQEEFQLQI